MVLASDLNSRQIISQIDIKRSIWKELYYNTLSSVIQYPSNPGQGWCTNIVYTEKPNDSSRVTLTSLVSDDDGGGLVDADYIRFFIQYVKSDNSRNDIQVLTIKVGDYTKLRFIDGQGNKDHIFLDKTFYLKDIGSGYENIRIISVGVQQVGGTVKGNEISVVVNFKQDY